MIVAWIGVAVWALALALFLVGWKRWGDRMAELDEACGEPTVRSMRRVPVVLVDLSKSRSVSQRD